MFETLHQEFDDLFGRLAIDWDAKRLTNEFRAACDLSETADAYQLRMDVPGIKPDDTTVQVADLTAEAARQLGDTEAAGVAITSVKPDSPAPAEGLHDGMLIEKVRQRRVTTVAEFREALKEASIEKGVLLLVRSPRGSKFVVLRKDAL